MDRIDESGFNRLSHVRFFLAPTRLLFLFFRSGRTARCFTRWLRLRSSNPPAPRSRQAIAFRKGESTEPATAWASSLGQTGGSSSVSSLKVKIEDEENPKEAAVEVRILVAHCWRPSPRLDSIRAR